MAREHHSDVDTRTGEGDRQLSALLVELAHSLDGEASTQAVLDHLVRRIVEILPVSAARVTLEPHDPEPVVACSAPAETDGGPHHLAVFTFPLRTASHQLGALDLFRDRPGPLDPGTVASARALADVTSSYLSNARTRRELRAEAERSHDRSLHDALTGLPNRVLLIDRLEQAVRRSTRTGGAVAVLFADLDGFKGVNDRHGHRAGDELLVAVAERIHRVIRPGDTLARMSGDEFVVLCEDATPAQVDSIATRVAAALEKPFTLTDAVVHIDVSIGIAISEDGAVGAGSLLRDADDAMYQVKRKGGGRHQLVDRREQQLDATLAQLQDGCRSAIAAGQLRLRYRPILGTGDGAIRGVGAVVHWQHPLRGPIPASVLVPLAERVGLLPDLGSWVLRTALDDLAPARERAPLPLAVKVSAAELVGGGYLERMDALLEGVDPSSLILDVSRSAHARYGARIAVVLRSLRERGVTLALDEFGSGRASFAELRQIPVDVIRLGRDLVTGVARDRTSRAIARSITALAHELDLTVVADGVDTEEQRRELARLGCDAWQGDLATRPLSADGLIELLEARTA